MFKIMSLKGVVDSPGQIPWDLIAPFEAAAERNHGQSLERLNERGGLDPLEAYAVMRGLRWPEVCNLDRQMVVNWLNARVKEFNQNDTAEKIAAWMEGLSRHPACQAERRYWYEGVAADVRGGAWKLT
jgi:hypothetical protein